MSNFCYVCEGELNPFHTIHCEGKSLCSIKCQESYEVLRKMATRLQNSNAELFAPFDFGLNETSGEEPEQGSFVLPVCIEAVPLCESDVIFLVKEINGKITFQPRKSGAKLFNSVEDANNYIQTTLKLKCSEKWSFVLWSYSALNK